MRVACNKEDACDEGDKVDEKTADGKADGAWEGDWGEEEAGDAEDGDDYWGANADADDSFFGEGAGNIGGRICSDKDVACDRWENLLRVGGAVGDGGSDWEDDKGDLVGGVVGRRGGEKQDVFLGGALDMGVEEV